MDFTLSAKTIEYAAKLQTFMDAEIFPAESIYHQQRQELSAAGKAHHLPPVIEELKKKARSLGSGIFLTALWTWFNRYRLCNTGRDNWLVT